MAGAARVGQRSACIEPSPFDAAHRLRRRRRASARRHAAVPVQDDRLRQDLDAPRLEAAAATSTCTPSARIPPKRGQLYLGTERGVMFSTDDGETWRPLQLNLPTVAVHDLVVKGDDLVVGTHGRSIWILDDLQPVREMTRRSHEAAVHLFPAAGRGPLAHGRRQLGARLREASRIRRPARRSTTSSRRNPRAN